MKIIKIKSYLVFSMFSLLPLISEAENITASMGETAQGQMTRRLSFEKPWQDKIAGSIGGYWDSGVTYWSKGDKASGRWSISFSPVFVYEFIGEQVKPYLEVGVGVAAFSGTTVGDRDLGSSIHFEDRIGAGIRFRDTTKVGIRAIHYSNAGIKEPNAGVESFSIFISMPF